ncbi:MAG TPA: von Willebrand factor type A domain-containing protein, partial [Aggregatilineales bacterium]|nr:von Willebrand factor type A domain-containing protein [Aggregatilineales bacterium]
MNRKALIPGLIIVIVVVFVAGIALVMVSGGENGADSGVIALQASREQNEQVPAAPLDFAESEADEALNAPGQPVGSAGIMATAPAIQQGQQSAAATPSPAGTPQDMSFEDYGVNPFLDTQDDHLSTFAMDVDTASYTLTRNYLMQQGQLPPSDAVRPEEFINYFETDYAAPEDEAFAIHLDAVSAPFGYDGHYLLRVGIQGQVIAPEDRTPAFLIFVIDVSGSMDMENRLGLVKESLALLVDELREDDRVAIAVYSDNSRVVLDATPASEKRTIMNAINALRPEGSTNVDAGLRLGYDLALENKREGELTRVIVLSDGVANVDVTSPDGILKNINEGVESGVVLSTIGFGMGNYNDVLMEQLADKGNGNYYYIDNLRQAREIFVYSLTGTLQVIGYDAKVQVDFNPEVTDRYRLIGYENRAIADQDFRNDDVDAGEVGAGHSITALYEVALDDGDYAAADTVATVYIRYQDADTREVVELNQSLSAGDLHESIDDMPQSLRLHAAAAEFAELLRESFWAEDGNYVDLLTFAAPLEQAYPDNEQVGEFVEMVRAAGR